MVLFSALRKLGTFVPEPNLSLWQETHVQKKVFYQTAQSSSLIRKYVLAFSVNYSLITKMG